MTCAWLIMALSVWTSLNPYYGVLWLESKATAVDADRAKSREVGARLLASYERLESLSFVAETTDYWCYHHGWRSYLPMALWRHRQVARSDVSMSRETTSVDVWAQGRHAYSFSLSGLRFTETYWPPDGAPAQTASYPFDQCDFQVGPESDGHLQCVIGGFRVPWAGVAEKSKWLAYRRAREVPCTGNRPLYIRRTCESTGRWIGRLSDGEEVCDVVFAQDEDRWDAYWINDRGMLKLWLICMVGTKGGDDRYVQMDRYHEYSIKE